MCAIPEVDLYAILSYTSAGGLASKCTIRLIWDGVSTWNESADSAAAIGGYTGNKSGAQYSDCCGVAANPGVHHFWVKCNNLFGVYFAHQFVCTTQAVVETEFRMVDDPAHTCSPFAFSATPQGGSLCGDDSVSVSTVVPGTLIVPVTGCNGLPLQGANVQAFQAGTLALQGNALTDSAGNASIRLPAGSYDYRVSRTRFTTSSVFGSVSVTNGATTTTSTVALAATSSFVCIPGAAVPLPQTLTCTVRIGVTTYTISLTWSATTSKWSGCVNRTVTGSIDSACNSATTASVSCPIRGDLTTGMVLTLTYLGCPPGTTFASRPTNFSTCANFATWGTRAYPQTQTLSGSLTPLSVTSPANFVLPSGTAQVGVMANGLATVTE